MKLDKKMIIGAVAAGVTAALVYLGNALALPGEIIAGVVAGIAWIAAWLNGRDNTVA